jgi:hypothetical protein
VTATGYRALVEDATEKIVAWIVNHGAVDTGPPDPEDSMSLRMVILDDLECFVGGATCDPVEPAYFATDKELIVEYEHEVPHHHLEIAALVPLVSPVAPGDLEAIVDDLNPGVVETYVSACPGAEDIGGGQCEELSVAIAEGSRMDTWVTRRLTFHDVSGDTFDEIMNEFVALARTTCKKIWECPPQ